MCNEKPSVQSLSKSFALQMPRKLMLTKKKHAQIGTKRFFVNMACCSFEAVV